MDQQPAPVTGSNGPRYVDAAVDARVGDRHRLLTYALPEHLAERITVRQLIWVPLRNELRLAIVLHLHSDPPEFTVRPVYAPVEPEFRLSERQWELITWLAEATICTIFEAAAPFLPPGVNQRSVEHLRLTPDAAEMLDQKLPRLQQALVDLLRERGEISVETARRALKSSLKTVIPKLEAAGIVERTARVVSGTVRMPTERYVVLSDGASVDLARAPAQRRALEVVRRRAALAHGQPIPWRDLTRRPGVTAPALRALADRGVLQIIELPAPPHVTLSGSGGQRAGGVSLTVAQAAAWREILTALRSGQSAEFLLHGITGSGKTEIYLRAAAWCLSRGRAVIMLVPEIALAAQIVTRFTERFPDQVAVLHSALSDGVRYHTWTAIAAGRIPIVVGPRSALFAPLDRVGLVIMDEEHEGAYKQDSPPRYHARDVARRLIEQHGAVLVLGSATPDVATYHAAETGAMRLVELPERVGPMVLGPHGRLERGTLELPPVEVVDMRLELQQGNTHLFSRALRKALHQALDAGEQAILFLNRRGSSTFIQCRACGHVEQCPFCDIPLVYHADRQLLLCHRCNHRQLPPRTCPACASRAVGYYGTGTQRVANEVERLFPDARVLRWDQDALRRGVEHRHLMQKVLRHEVDVIVGTQMVAKGLDFPLVSTIGVINADTLLHLPDFRSGERTFQLITQVAGRAGRRAPGGRVIVQSYSPDHYAIDAASRHDYATFYREEIAFRRRYGYPPFRRLIRLVYRHQDEATCALAAAEVADLLATTADELELHDLDLLGPNPAFAARVRGRYQWQILVRGPDAHAVVSAVDLDPGWMIDVDPLSVL